MADPVYKSISANGLSVLPPLTQMRFNEYLESPSKRFKLAFQPDSNLALYDGPTAVWAANGGTPYSSEVFPQRWGINEVSAASLSYQLSVIDRQRSRLWNSVNSTPLDGNVNAASQRTFLQLQDDGNIVIIDAIPVWASNTSIPVTPDQPAVLIPPGTLIFPGQTFAVGTSLLAFQGDGNLVLYGANGSVLWSPYTGNQGGAVAIMQNDGNFVVYDGVGKALWNTGTTAFPGAYGRLQSNGSFSIVTDKVVWARFGFTPEVQPPRFLVQYGPYTVWSYDL